MRLTLFNLATIGIILLAMISWVMSFNGANCIDKYFFVYLAQAIAVVEGVNVLARKL